MNAHVLVFQQPPTSSKINIFVGNSKAFSTMKIKKLQEDIDYDIFLLVIEEYDLNSVICHHGKYIPIDHFRVCTKKKGTWFHFDVIDDDSCTK